MHTVIRILVYAKDPKDALIAANEVAGKMGNQTSGSPFDYYEDFSQPELRLSGRDRRRSEEGGKPSCNHRTNRARCCLSLSRDG